MVVKRSKAKKNFNQIVKGLIGEAGISEATLLKRALDKGMTEEQIKAVLIRFQALEIAALNNGVWSLK